VLFYYSVPDVSRTPCPRLQRMGRNEICFFVVISLLLVIGRCGCEECIRESTEDSLRHSLARLNEYRALASPSLIALSSTDPILTAFQLSWELRNLAFAEQVSNGVIKQQTIAY
jgi:hypothetical protein